MYRQDHEEERARLKENENEKQNSRIGAVHISCSSDNLLYRKETESHTVVLSTMAPEKHSCIEKTSGVYSGTTNQSSALATMSGRALDRSANALSPLRAYTS